MEKRVRFLTDKERKGLDNYIMREIDNPCYSGVRPFLMNKNVRHGSLEEIQALNDRAAMDNMSSEEKKRIRSNIVKEMEEYDPGGKRAHVLASKYR